MSALKHHVPDVVVVVALLVSENLEADFCPIVLDMAGYGHSESSMVYLVGVCCDPRNGYALCEENRPRPSTPHQLVLGLDYQL